MNRWFPGPSAGEERAEAVRRLVPGAQAETPWRHYGMLLRIVFTIFAAIAVSAAFGFFSLLLLPKGWLTAALAIGASEWLIRRHRFFGTGVESSLWLCGTFAFIFGLPSQGKVEAILVFALAAALSGWRMRNAFFGVFAAVLVLAYIAAKWDHTPTLVMSIASLFAIASALALRRVWQRPSTARLFAGLVLTMPVTGYLASVMLRSFTSTFRMSLPIVAILGITAVVLLAAGIAWRDRVIMVAAAFSAALTAIELRELFDYPAEARLIAAGVVVIAIAAAIDRALRHATGGIVVTPIASSAYDEAIQIGGIIAVAPHGDAPAAHAHTGPELADSSTPTDKSFGGAGAGGEY